MNWTQKNSKNRTVSGAPDTWVFLTADDHIFLLRKLAHAIYRFFFFGCKNENFQLKIFDIFLIFAQNIDYGYTLELPRRGGSNEIMFGAKIQK